MSSAHEALYHDAMPHFLESLPGEGYLSPGSPQEVVRLIDGIELSAKTVLDFGCRPGGITVGLGRDHTAAKIVGVKVE